MSLKESFKKQIQKSLATVKEFNLSNKEQLLLNLHSLKGDLAWLDDFGILEILSEITELAKLNSGDKELVMKKTDQLENRIEISLPSKGFELQKRLESTLETINANLGKSLSLKIDFAHDPDEKSQLVLGRVLIPLLINSAVHGTDKTGQISILLNKKDDSWHFHVQDSGKSVKITKEEAKNLSGEGLGLAQVKELVYSNGGEFELLRSGNGAKAIGKIPF